ncbi:MAG: type II toxin-antitoxin system VapC family toxin [Candidatus Binatia bacterium]
MRLLLDTHVLIWLSEGLEELRPSARRVVERGAARDGLAVSAISFWEVAMLEQRRRLSLSTPLPEWRRRVLEAPGITEAVVSGDIAIEAVQLPGELHADPADRILVATARVLGLRLVTRDERLIAYGRAGHVSAAAV